MLKTNPLPFEAEGQKLKKKKNITMAQQFIGLLEKLCK